MYIPPLENENQVTRDPTLLIIRPWCIFLLSCIILYLPPGIYELTPAIVGLVIERAASFVPSISHWVELSPFSWNTRLFLVFAWAMIPVQTYWLVSSRNLRKFYKNSYRAKNMRRTNILQIFGIIGLSTFMSALIYLGFNFVIIDTPPCHVCVNTNRLAQLFIGCIYSMTISMGLTFLATSLSVLIDQSLKIKDKNCA